MILSINGNPVNGIDTAKYQQLDLSQEKPDWLWFWGIKACDIAKNPKVDLNFQASRNKAMGWKVRWRSFYIYLRSGYDMSDQMALFCQTVGTLVEGESVYLDWEDKEVTLADIRECERVMDVVYPNRWMMYVNNTTQDMITWMEERAKRNQYEAPPLMHPDWRHDGWRAAETWGAAVWQSGIAKKGQLPELVTESDCDIDWVRLPEQMDRITNRW